MGGSNNAQQAAQQAEEQRRKDILATQKAIEGIYNTPQRAAQIQDLINSTRTYLGQDLGRQNTIAGRNLKFALARSGQTINSLDANQHRELGQNYLRGALEVERRANAAGNSLRQSDQQSKLALFSEAQGGLDQTTAARNALESMRSNIGMAKSDATQSGLGDLFSSFADIYKNSQVRKGTADAEKYQYGTFYAPSAYSSGPPPH